MLKVAGSNMLHKAELPFTSWNMSLQLVTLLQWTMGMLQWTMGMLQWTMGMLQVEGICCLYCFAFT